MKKERKYIKKLSNFFYVLKGKTNSRKKGMLFYGFERDVSKNSTIWGKVPK